MPYVKNQEGVNRRVGGLEVMVVGKHKAFAVNRRVGGLEADRLGY